MALDCSVRFHAIALGIDAISGVLEEDLQGYGVKPINQMLATLLIAPQAALLLGLVIDEDNKLLRLLGFIALAVFLVFLVALERRTGQVSILVAIVTGIVLYQNRIWYFVFGVAVVISIAVFVVFPEFVLSRGLSWRPAIWLSTLNSIANAPIFGHGITNTVTPVIVFTGESGATEQFRHPHNMALSVTYFLGLVGLAFWSLIWVPGVWGRITQRSRFRGESYIVISLLVGVAALMFDGGEPLSPFHFDWFCFWVPAALMLSCQAVRGQRLFRGSRLSLRQRFFPPSKIGQIADHG